MAEAGTNKSSAGAARGRVVEIVDVLEKSLLGNDPSGIRNCVESLRTELIDVSTTLAALEGGALHALITVLALVSRDDKVAESILGTIHALGKRPSLSHGVSVSIASLLRAEGVSAVIRSAERFRQSAKIRDLVLKVVGNCAGDELGSRILVYSKGCSLLVELIRRFPQDRVVVLSCLSSLSSCCMYHVSARGEVLGSDPLILQLLLSVGRSYRLDADITENILSILCLISTARAGAKAILSIPVSPLFVDAAKCAVEAAALASNALDTFAVRSYQKSVDDTRQLNTPASGGTLGESTLDLFKNQFQRFATSVGSPSAPAVSVVTHQERRCCAWGLMLLHNLALETTDSKTRKEMVQVLQHQSDENSRQLYTRILERVRVLSMQSSENVQEEDVEHQMGARPSQLIELAIPRLDEDFHGDEAALALLVNLPYLQAKGDESADPAKLVQSVCAAIAIETTSLSLSPLPVSPSTSRQLSLVFGMFTQPYIRERLTPAHFDLAADTLLEALRQGDPPEFFKHMAKAMEAALGNKEPRFPLIPHRSLPQLATTLPFNNPAQQLAPSTPNGAVVGTPGISTPVKGRSGGPTPLSAGGSIRNNNTPTSALVARSILSTPATATATGSNRNLLHAGRETVPDSPGDFSLFEWRQAPKELCRQITLKMERMYGAVNPCTLLLLDGVLDENAAKFCKFHASLVTFFKREILSRNAPEDRGSLVDCIIAIASFAAHARMSNVDLTMACLEALESPSVKRLAITWRRVRPELVVVLTELKHLSRFEDMQDPGWSAVAHPPPFLSAPAVPYLGACLAALRALQEQTTRSGLGGSVQRDVILARYGCLNAWLPHMSRKGDWHPFYHMFSPHPVAQMALANLVKSAPPLLSIEEYQVVSASSSINEVSNEKLYIDNDLIDTDQAGDSSFKADTRVLGRSASDVYENIMSYKGASGDVDMVQFSMALEPLWALEQADMEEKLLVRDRKSVV